MNRRPEAEAARLVPRAEAGSGSAPLPVRAETETGSGAVVRTPAARRAAAALRYHARELWLNPGRLLHSLYHGKPGSMAEHMAYLKSAAWVPEEMTGKPRAFLVWTGIAYQLIIAWPLMAAAKAIGAAAPHPLCMLAIAVFVIALIVLL
jgi:hypothetical protein